MSLARQFDAREAITVPPCRTRLGLDPPPLVAPKAANPPRRLGVAMVTLDRDGFLELRRALPAATKDGLRDTFGVSETTWVKLRDGRPIKKVTLERLLARYRKIVGAESA